MKVVELIELKIYQIKIPSENLSVRLETDMPGYIVRRFFRDLKNDFEMFDKFAQKLKKEGYSGKIIEVQSNGRVW
jgi:hypothetical protein